MTAESLKGRYEEFQVVAKQRDSFSQEAGDVSNG